MSAAATPLECFQLRCWARGYLFAAGHLTLHEAVDLIQEVAEAYGLINEIGQDAVQGIMALEFGKFRDDLLVDKAVQHGITVEAAA